MTVLTGEEAIGEPVAVSETVDLPEPHCGLLLMSAAWQYTLKTSKSKQRPQLIALVGRSESTTLPPTIHGGT